MAPKKSKGTRSKGKQRAAAAPDANASTEPPNVDRAASLDGAAAASPDRSINSEPPDVDYEAELNRILLEYDEAQAQAARSSNIGDNTSRNDSPLTVPDSDLEVSNRFPNIEELTEQITRHPFELRQELNLPPPALHEGNRPVWDAIADNHHVLKNVRDASGDFRASWTKNYDAGKALCATSVLWQRQTRHSKRPGRVPDQAALILQKRLFVEMNVAEAREQQYDADREQYLSAEWSARTTINVSRKLAEKVALENSIVLVSELEDLEDVYWDRGNELALERVISQHEEALERWHNSKPDGDEPTAEPKGPTAEPKGPTAEPKGPAGEPEKTTREGDETGAPDEVETPLRRADYVVWTYARDTADQTAAVPEPQHVSPSVPTEVTTDREKSRADSGAGAEATELRPKGSG